MENITEHFNRQFAPFKAILLYRTVEPDDERSVYRSAEDDEMYVESFDIGKNGQPINAHPLTIPEMMALGDIFNSSKELNTTYLRSKGIIPPNVLYVDQRENGFAVWYTPPMQADLFFTEQLAVPNGRAQVPALLWKATKTGLSVYALKSKGKPNDNSLLYHAPFFNIYAGGNVCMGTVSIDVTPQTRLEDFMQQWHAYFFRSNFSHSINGDSSTRNGTAALWRKLIGTKKPFPADELVPCNRTLKQILI